MVKPIWQSDTLVNTTYIDVYFNGFRAVNLGLEVNFKWRYISLNLLFIEILVSFPLEVKNGCR